MSRQPRNIFGEILPDYETPILRKKKYATKSGYPRFGKKWAINADDKGFSTQYKIKQIQLKPGDIIVRYGAINGRFFTKPNTPYEMLSMPYKEESLAFHAYQVNERYKGEDIYCLEGVIAPDFEQAGLGTQYYFEQYTIELLKKEYLIEISAEPYYIMKGDKDYGRSKS